MKTDVEQAKDEYVIAKEVAKKAGCFLPKDHIFYLEVANTPAYLRFYFERKGFSAGQKNKKENMIITVERCRRIIKMERSSLLAEIKKEAKFYSICLECKKLDCKVPDHMVHGDKYISVKELDRVGGKK